MLASPDYALHMARVFDVMLIERRIPTVNSYDVPAASWRAYLAESFAENKPWDQMVREILGSDGADERLSGAVKFYLVRDVAPHQLTRDVGRLFLGIDLQCAQCHDDPRFEDYRQADYYGIYAFLQRLKMHPLDASRSTTGRNGGGQDDVHFGLHHQSGETNPRLPGGEMIADPPLGKGEGVRRQTAGPKDAAIPTYSRRLKLAEQLPRPETKGFARNIANRLWALMLGRGLVHPLDLHHAAIRRRIPSCSIGWNSGWSSTSTTSRAFCARSRSAETYQRSSVLPTSVQDLPAEAFAVAPLRGLDRRATALVVAASHRPDRTALTRQLDAASEQSVAAEADD